MHDEVLIFPGLNASECAALKARCFQFSSLAPRAADLLRAGSAPLQSGAFSAYQSDQLVGSVSLWPIVLRGDTGDVSLSLLGPLMVDPSVQGCGLGGELMDRALGCAPGPVMLIGDEAYYARFGFSAAQTQGWQLPGLYAQERVLLRRSAAAALPNTGQVLPAFAPPAGKQAAA